MPAHSLRTEGNRASLDEQRTSRAFGSTSSRRTMPLSSQPSLTQPLQVARFSLVTRLARAALSWVLACVLLGSVVFGGTSFRWCVPMHQAMAACCCHVEVSGMSSETASSETASSDTASSGRTSGADTVRKTCCEIRSIDALEPASVAELSASLPAFTATEVQPRLVFVTEPPVTFESVPPAVDSRARVFARAGPTTRLHRQNSVWLV